MSELKELKELKEKVKATAQKPAADAPVEDKAACEPLPDKRQPDPKPVKLVKRLGPDGKPEDRPPEPPLAVSGGPVPRLCHQNERAVDGLVRFKVAARNHNPQPVRYILARTRAEAEQLYVESTGLDSHVEQLLADSEAALEDDLRLLRMRAIHSPDLASEAARLENELRALRVRAVPRPQLVVTRLPD